MAEASFEVGIQRSTNQQVQKIRSVLSGAKHHYVYMSLMKLQTLMIERDWEIKTCVGELKRSESITAVLVGILHGVGVLDIGCDGLSESHKKGFGQELRWDTLGKYQTVAAAAAQRHLHARDVERGIPQVYHELEHMANNGQTEAFKN